MTEKLSYCDNCPNNGCCEIQPKLNSTFHRVVKVVDGFKQGLPAVHHLPNLVRDARNNGCIRLNDFPISAVKKPKEH